MKIKICERNNSAWINAELDDLKLIVWKSQKQDESMYEDRKMLEFCLMKGGKKKIYSKHLYNPPFEITCNIYSLEAAMSFLSGVPYDDEYDHWYTQKDLEFIDRNRSDIELFWFYLEDLKRYLDDEATTFSDYTEEELKGFFVPDYDDGSFSIVYV